MKRISVIFLTLVLMMAFSASAFAGGNATINDDIMYIYKTATEPTIDGELDEVWFYTTAIPLLLIEGAPEDTVGVYDDHFSQYRVMWDDDYFYFFAEIVDDELSNSAPAEPWMNDAVEIFFDGGNEKASSYDDNDVQWRWVYGDVAGDTNNIGHNIGDFMFKDTESGYNFELRIHQDSLHNGGENLFTYEGDSEIGFEVSNADRDNEDREEVSHWWTTDGNTWQDASLFGTALLVENEVDDALKIQYTDTEPTIDGTFEEGEGWEYASELSLTLIEGDAVIGDTVFADWKDHMASYYAMWDENYFYFFAKVIDEELSNSAPAEPWMNDAVEIFFDGGNEKATSYDDNDVQWRWVYGDVTGDTNNIGHNIGEFMYKDTDNGYNFELRIHKDSLHNGGDVLFPLELDTEIGFEVSNADRDNEDRESVKHWWTTDGNTWQDASLFGTAILADELSFLSVEPVNDLTPESFILGQNYPNPFNPSTTIDFSIQERGQVTLKVYDVIGRVVATLVNEHVSAGNYSVNFNASQLSSGVYFYRLTTGNETMVRKMMLLK